MKTVADVIAELTMAAKEVHTLTESQKLRMLCRAYVTIKEGWELVGEPTRLHESAEAIHLTRAGDMPVHLYDDEMKAILLEAAKVIRQIEAAMRTKSGAVSDASPKRGR